MGLLPGLTAIAAGIGLCGAATAATPAQNKAIVARTFDAWAAGTGSPFDLLSDDAVWTIEGNSIEAGTYAGKQIFIDKVIQLFNARMSVGLKPTVRSITAEENRVVILFDGRATARDGRPYTNSYAWFFQMKEGRVRRVNAFFDAVAFNELWTRVAPGN